MFVGTVSCEIEVGKAQNAFRGFRMLLVEPEHKVDWEGPVVAIDTVQARVGDLVVVALAPFGPALDIPADLPVEAAVVAIVRSLSGAAPRGAPPGRPAPAAAPAVAGPPMAARPVVEPADVVPRHIRSLMEGSAPPREDERPFGPGGREGGRRRLRRRGGRGGRGRPDDLPETEGEFLEDESRFEPERETSAASTNVDEDEPAGEPERAPFDRQGPRGHDRGESREDRGGRDRVESREDRSGRDRVESRDDRGGRDRVESREDRGRRDRGPDRPRREVGGERPPEFRSRPAPPPPRPVREDLPRESAEAAEQAWSGGWREAAPEPEVRREPPREPPREALREPVRPQVSRPAASEGGVVWDPSAMKKPEGFEIGEGARMGSGVKRPRRRRGGGK